MSETPATPEAPRRRRPVFEKDAYPKGIIVCMVISMVLFVVIMTSIFLDLTSTERDAPANMTPEERAFFEEHGVSTEPRGRSFLP